MPFAASDAESRWFLREQLDEGAARTPDLAQVQPAQAREVDTSPIGLREYRRLQRVHPVQPVDVDESRDPQAKPPPSVPKELLQSLEELCRWAATEGGLKTAAELLDAVREPDRLPPDLEYLWAEAIRSTISTSTGFDPFSPILDWYRSLDERPQVILSSRALVLSKARNLQDIASEFGVSRERIRQVEARLIEDLERLFQTRAWEAVRWRVHHVRQVGGAAFPYDDEATETLLVGGRLWSEIEADIVRGVILRFAGPYELAHDWLVTDAEELEATRLGLLERIRDTGSIELDTAREVMEHVGLRPRVFAAWLSQRSGMREIRGSVVEWPRTLCGRVLSLMRLRGSPLSPDELLADLGPEVDVRSLKQNLSSNTEFVRVGRSMWGLRTWGLPEYEGIAAAISDELSKNGPSLSIDDLARHLSGALGVADSSVIALCQAPRFVVENRIVRHRRADELFPVTTDLSQARGVFRPSDSEVSILVDIDHDLLRGSGRPVAEPVAGLLALQPGQSRDYKTGSEDIHLSWPDTSISGPAIGSLRVHAERLGGSVGDRLRVTFHIDTASADVNLVAKRRLNALQGDMLLAEVTGLTERGHELRVKLAAAVGSNSTGLTRFLRRRGDTELADHLPAPDASSGLEERLDRLARLFES